MVDSKDRLITVQDHTTFPALMYKQRKDICRTAGLGKDFIVVFRDQGKSVFIKESNEILVGKTKQSRFYLISMIPIMRKELRIRHRGLYWIARIL